MDVYILLFTPSARHENSMIEVWYEVRGKQVNNLSKLYCSNATKLHVNEDEKLISENMFPPFSLQRAMSGEERKEKAGYRRGWNEFFTVELFMAMMNN